MPFFVFLRDHCVLVMLFHFMYLIFLDWPFQALSIAYFSSALRCSCDKLHCFNSDLLGNHSFLEASIFSPTLRVSRIRVCASNIMCYSFFKCPDNALSNCVFRNFMRHFLTMLRSDEKCHLRALPYAVFGFSRNYCVFVMLFHIMYLVFSNCSLNALSIAYFSSALRCLCIKLRCVDSDLVCNRSFLEVSIFSPTLRVSRFVVHASNILCYSFLKCPCNALSNAMFVSNIGHSSKKLYYPKHAHYLQYSTQA